MNAFKVGDRVRVLNPEYQWGLVARKEYVTATIIWISPDHPTNCTIKLDIDKYGWEIGAVMAHRGIDKKYYGGRGWHMDTSDLCKLGRSLEDQVADGVLYGIPLD